MGIEAVLSRLKGLKPSGLDKWIARCPAHKDRSPSLTIRAIADGRILMHCFAGCGTDAVLDALGLKFTELFAERMVHDGLERIPQPFSPLDALKCLTAESVVVAIVSSDIALGKAVSDADAHRVAVAAGRIASALEVIHQ